MSDIQLTDDEREHLLQALIADFDHPYTEADYSTHVHLGAAVESIIAARTDTPLRADHPAITAAQKQGHENGWNAAGYALRDMADELARCRAECEHLNRCLNEAGERILDQKYSNRKHRPRWNWRNI